MDFTETDKNKFTEFLLSIGFNKSGVADIVKRFSEGRPDGEDLSLYERWKAAEH